MKFNEKLAVELLKVVDNITSKYLLRPPEKLHFSEAQQLVSKQLDGIAYDSILHHLYILSHSGFISPQLDIDELRKTLAETQHTDRSETDGFFLFQKLPKIILTRSTLTFKAYKYLEDKNQVNKITDKQGQQGQQQ